MGLRKLILLASVLLFISTNLFAQNQLSDAEVQDFFKLIKATKTYKDLKTNVDSFNTAAKMEVQEIKTRMYVKKNAPVEENIAHATVERRLGSFALQTFYFSYDKKKKQLVSSQY